MGLWATWNLGSVVYWTCRMWRVDHQLTEAKLQSGLSNSEQQCTVCCLSPQDGRLVNVTKTTTSMMGLKGFRDGEVERWRGGEVERWRGGRLEGWRGREVEGWRGGEVLGWLHFWCFCSTGTVRKERSFQAAALRETFSWLLIILGPLHPTH